MTANDRRQLSTSVATTLTICLLFVASVAIAQSNAGATKGADVMQDRGPADDIRLPDHARAGTGQTGSINASALGARRLTLTLPDGRTLDAILQRVVRDRSAGRLSWIGTLQDRPDSLLTLTQYRGVITGFLNLDGETWEIMPTSGGKHLIYEVDQDKLPENEPAIEPEDIETDPASGRDARGDVSAAAGTNGFVHDVLVLYTPASRSRYGQATLESMVQNAVAAANQAYLNSNVDLTLNLVGLQEINYTESGNTSTSLSDLRGTSDGKMDDAHAIRDSVGADVVTLLTQDTGTCGRAYAMTRESTGFASSAFNIVIPNCLSGFSLPHEIGHNQGSRHNRESTSGVGAFDYSYGYRRCATDGTGFATVMSYRCSGANRVGRFSNPNVNYSGNPTGIAYESDPSNSAENARSISNTADTVAAFRDSVDSGSPPAAPTSLAAMSTSSSSITVNWNDTSTDETGFRLERSEDNVNYAEIATLGAGATEHVDGGLPASTTYYYRVRAYNGSGNSAYSNTGSATTQADSTTPKPPSGLIAD